MIDTQTLNFLSETVPMWIVQKKNRDHFTINRHAINPKNTLLITFLFSDSTILKRDVLFLMKFCSQFVDTDLYHHSESHFDSQLIYTIVKNIFVVLISNIQRQKIIIIFLKLVL